VVDAAVVGITINGEESPRAYVVPRTNRKSIAPELQRFVAGRVSKHKRLAGGVKFVDAIPRLASGKIIRRVLKEWAKDDVKVIRETFKARL
jgi:acyl-coenzyme A synthetase/AMP-(fatty) acid ligase